MISLKELAAVNDGELPNYAWPGGYPIVYIASDGEPFCPDCANDEGFRLEPNIPGEDDRDGFLLVGYAIHWEGPPEICGHCGAEIESVYGDPDEPV